MDVCHITEIYNGYSKKNKTKQTLKNKIIVYE